MPSHGQLWNPAHNHQAEWGTLLMQLQKLSSIPLILKATSFLFPSLLETSLNKFLYSFCLSIKKYAPPHRVRYWCCAAFLSPWWRQLGSSYWTGLCLLARWMALMQISLGKYCLHCQNCFIQAGWSARRPNSDIVYWVITASHELGGIVTGLHA